MNNPRPITETQLRLVKPFLKWFTRLNVRIYQWTGGRLFNRIGGGEICIVTMTGAKSGLPREFPLIYVAYQDGIVLVASFAGGPNHPTWYYNLIAHPEIEVTVRERRFKLIARCAKSCAVATMLPTLSRFCSVSTAHVARYPSLYLCASCGGA